MVADDLRADPLVASIGPITAAGAGAAAGGGVGAGLPRSTLDLQAETMAAAQAENSASR